MALGFIAPVTRFYTLDAERVIFTGSGVIYSVTYTNKTGATVVVAKQNAAGTAIGEVNVPANQSFEERSPKLYEAGYKFASASSASVSVEVASSNTAGSV